MTHDSFPLAPPEPSPSARRADPAVRPWAPVPRKPRSDGWTPQRQRAFVAALAESGCVEHAARSVGISATSCYRLRRATGAAGFAAAWDAALRSADRRQREAWQQEAWRTTEEDPSRA